jgi:flavin reductase (DIM6/NTAB) family NADH-FMN oxidoreductase RutF
MVNIISSRYFNNGTSSINNRLYNKKPGNVFLHDNLYKQVQIAYAIPRNILLITVGNENLFNLFPTDLHGQVGEEHYIISLRTGGKAAAQVADAGKLAISQVHAEAYKTVYGLGKNHMQELKPRDNFLFGALSSASFQLPLPRDIFSYLELHLQDSFTHGIHTIFLFSILHQQQIRPAIATLAHIHNCYASWRYKNGLPGNYLLR